MGYMCCVGSIGLEALRISPKIKLMAIEKRLGGKELIEANAKRLGVTPNIILEDNALEILRELQLPNNLIRPDRVVLGGGGINRNELLNMILNLLEDQGIVVIPLSTLEAISELQSILKLSSLDVKISQHQSWRGVPLAAGTRMSPVNPVFIIKAEAPAS